MKFLQFGLLILAGFSVSGCVTASGDTAADKRLDIQNTRTNALTILNAKVPKSREKSDTAVGYAVFRQIGTSLLLGGTANGYGIVVNKNTGDEVYMRSLTGTIGLGAGFKDYRTIIYFYDEATLEKFTSNSWEAGTQFDAALKSKKRGGEMSGAGNIRRNMDVYQFTERGLFLRGAFEATRFWRSKKLNAETEEP